MGREKKHKPRKRRPWELTELQHSLAAFTRDSLWTLLAAAGRSPGVRHRWASVTHLVAVTLRTSETGHQIADASALPDLLRRAWLDEPSLQTLEDFMPENPRDKVVIEFNGRLYRLLGGNMERPVADVDRALLIADAADEVLLKEFGFGIRHVAEVLLDRVDRTLRYCAHAWPKDAQHEIGDVSVTFAQGEVVDEPEPTDWRGPHAAALEWLTRDARSVSYSTASSVSALGPVARVRFVGEDAPRWLPLGILPEALAHAVSELAAEAVRLDSDVHARYLRIMAARVRRRLWRFSDEVLGGPDDAHGEPGVARGNVAQWALRYGEREIVVVQVLVSLEGRNRLSGQPAVVKVARALRGGASQAVLPFPGGRVTFKQPAVVTPVVVLAGAGHLMAPSMPDVLNMSIEDLDWIAQTADRDSDLLNFAKELTDVSVPRILGLETMNVWEWWRENGGALHRGGKAPSFMAFEPHRTRAEWELARDHSDLSEALLLLSLPALRDWDMVELLANGPAQLLAWPETHSRWNAREGVHVRPAPLHASVHVSSTPAAFLVPALRPLPGFEAGALSGVAGAFGFALTAIEQVWVESLRDSPVHALTVWLEAGTGLEAPFNLVETSLSTGVGTARVLLDFERLGLETAGDAEAVRALMSALIGQILGGLSVAPRDRELVELAWNAAPPTLTAEQHDLVTRRNQTHAPVELEAALVAELDRQLAARVQQAGVEPGSYAPAEASALDRDVLAPAALDLLRTKLTAFSADDLVCAGMEQLERIVSHRDDMLRSTRRAARALALEWDPVARQGQIEADHAKVRRSAELIVEAALRFRPVGTATVDERGWAEVLAAAAAYLEATSRSEALHYQVSSTGLRIGDMYELSAIPWTPHESQLTLDVARYRRAAAEENLHDSSLDARDSPTLRRLIAAADVAFLDHEGASFSDLAIVLLAIAAWPLEESDGDAVLVEERALLDALTAHFAGSDEPVPAHRVVSAVQLLTSDTASYTTDAWDPWRMRSRRVRLLVKPLVLLSDGRYVVAPHFAHTSFRVFQGYWQAGQLPWSQAGSDVVDQALERLRDHRNLELEAQIDELLRLNGWRTVVRVKPGKAARLGLAALTTEIDIVAGRDDRDVIWVLEVKDPAPVFTSADIRRQIDRFFAGGRSHAAQLTRKLDEVSAAPEQVALTLGLPSDRARRVQSLFVTRRVVPAGFVQGQHPFVTAAKLLDRLSPATGDGASFDA